MSFIGDIIGGYGASELGKYNQSVAQAQARVDAAKRRTFGLCQLPRPYTAGVWSVAGRFV